MQCKRISYFVRYKVAFEIAAPLSPMMRTCYVLLAFILLHAGRSVAQVSFFTHLVTLPPEKITLTCEWDSLIILKDESSREALLHVINGNGTEEWKTELSVRGRFRRAKCVFPPLEINLKKKALRDHGMMEFDKLKLVTHCGTENADPADVFEELLIYQLYGILTPCSFRAIPLHIDYLHTNGKIFEKNADALLLEPTSELAHRLHAQELEEYGVSEDSLDAMSYCRNALFQFMIGNFDWDYQTQRNVKMIGQPGQYHLVPYDFDFSAIVMPVYARMPSDFGLKDFRDRVYLGQLFPEQLQPSIREFVEKKQELLAHVTNYPYLTKTRRREVVTYLEQFYKFIEEPAQVILHGTILPYRQE